MKITYNWLEVLGQAPTKSRKLKLKLKKEDIHATSPQRMRTHQWCRTEDRESNYAWSK